MGENNQIESGTRNEQKDKNIREMVGENLYKYVDYIFSFFEEMDCGVGRGLFLQRAVNSDKHNHKAPIEDRDIINRMIFILCVNDFIKVDADYNFFRLTEKGYQYIHGAKDVPILPYLRYVVDIQHEAKLFARDLWLMVGDEELSPFHIEEPLLYNAISSFLPDAKPYHEFVRERKQQYLSVHSIAWMETLLEKISKELWPNVADNLSTTISHEYFPEWFVNDDASNKQIDAADKGRSSKKQIFISYNHEDDAFNNWVKQLAHDLEPHFNVIIDSLCPLGKQWTSFMEEAIKKSDKVLLILTPDYKQKADARNAGVGYESNIITAEIWHKGDQIKYIPIVRKGTFEEAYPTFLAGANGLAMNDDNQYHENLNRLIEELKVIN